MFDRYFKTKLVVALFSILVLSIGAVMFFFAGVEYTLNKANVIAIGETDAIIAIGNDEHIIDLVRY